MVKSEVKSLFKNKLLLLVLVAIILIPVIYAGLFVGSIMDPYGNVDQLPVAVVNEDQPANYNDKELHVGDDLIEELKENDSLQFNFVDKEAAEEGLKNGTFYMTITVPEDFSKNATTLMDDHPKKMELLYATNPGTNYIASKMSETAVLKIRDSIQEAVVRSYTETIFDSLTEVGDGMQEAADGALELKDGIETASDGNAKITKNLKKLSDSTLAFEDGADTLQRGVKDYTDGVTKVNEGAKKLDDGVKQLTENAPALVEGVNTLDTGIKEYTSGVAKLNQGMSGLKEGCNNLVDGANQLQGGVDNLAAGMNAYSAGVIEIEKGIKGLYQQFGNVDNITNKELESLKNTLVALNEGVESLKQNQDQLFGGVQSLPEGVKGIANGLGKLNTGINQVSAGVGQLNENSSKLTSGSAQLVQGASTLGAGAKSLGEGTSQLYSGTKALTKNNKKLNQGSAQLAEGAGMIQEGSDKLYDGSQELGDGMKKLYDGSEELGTALQDGADEVKESEASDENIEMFAAPVEENGTQMLKVENNGHGMLPYMMSVGLWVGALAFCLIYPLMSYKGKLKSGFSWWASKAMILYPVALLQGVLLIALLHVFIGFDPVDMGRTIGLAIITAVAFTSIMYFFNITLGKVGSFVMLIYMVVQLAGSAGTYPVELSPHFVSVIHKYLPFTYTVDGFRRTIAGGESILPCILVLASIAVVFSILTIIAFQIKTKRIRENKFIFYEWLEEKGLA